METQAENIDGCALARDVIRTEANGLVALADSLGQSFEDVVQILQRVKGRVVVTGIGKSGHVGCKIAATMASTGTPAFFVHPSEASHGDLGMITQDDVVFAISNSGETKELRDLVEYCFQKSITLVGVTSRTGSMLDKMADATLLLPDVVGEACPLGLAPTTTTTMCMALGDALACTLLHLRGFTKRDFKSVHPGGSLGAQLGKSLAAKDLPGGRESCGSLPSCTKASFAEESEELSTVSENSDTMLMQTRTATQLGRSIVRKSNTTKKSSRFFSKMIIILMMVIVAGPICSYWVQLLKAPSGLVERDGRKFSWDEENGVFVEVKQPLLSVEF